MKLIPYLTLVVTLTTLPVFVHGADPAKEAKKAEKEQTTKVVKAIPFRGPISAIDAAANTFTISNKDKTKVRVYSVATADKLTKDDKDTTLADVKVGDYVRGSALKTATDKYDVKSAKFGPKTAEELAADKLKKEKKDAKAAPEAVKKDE